MMSRGSIPTWLDMNLTKQERLEKFFGRFPLLAPTIEKLNQENISFLIGGSGCLFVLGNERLPDDVDVYLLDEQHDIADKLFGAVSFTYESPVENVRNSNPQGDHSIQLTSHLRLQIQGKIYNLSLNADMLEHAIDSEFQGQKVRFLSPEDVLIIKALLQRGADVGKRDIEDIKKFMSIYPGLDRKYLEKRIQSLDAADRIGNIFSV